VSVPGAPEGGSRRARPLAPLLRRSRNLLPVPTRGPPRVVAVGRLGTAAGLAGRRASRRASCERVAVGRTSSSVAVAPSRGARRSPSRGDGAHTRDRSGEVSIAEPGAVALASRGGRISGPGQFVERPSRMLIAVATPGT
ncbi:unnamed protein product, partial [Ixodes pacificus]